VPVAEQTLRWLLGKETNPKRIVLCVCSVPVAQDLMEADDGVLLLLREAAPLQVGAQVVDPPKAAALAAPLQPCIINGGRRSARQKQQQ
jgi:hypothetical protein